MRVWSRGGAEVTCPVLLLWAVVHGGQVGSGGGPPKLRPFMVKARGQHGGGRQPVRTPDLGQEAELAGRNSDCQGLVPTQ